MKLQFYNCPEPEKLVKSHFPKDDPDFILHKPDFNQIHSIVGQYQQYTNLLIVGYGGSITSFWGVYHAFAHESSKRVYFLNTIDPDYIFELKQNLVPEETLVVAISKSGETVTQIEGYIHFVEYPSLFITSSETTLEHIAERLGCIYYPYPAVGGRFTGMTEVALVPAALCGFDIEAMHNGAKQYYEKFREDNLAWRAASVLWQLEKEKKYEDVFMPFYSHYLFQFSRLIVQLCHETFAKDGKGQTYFAHEAPESQHHTNQRFLGGQKNVAGFIISQDAYLHDTITSVPPALHSVKFRDQDLYVVNKLPMERSFAFEFQSTTELATSAGIPILSLSVTSRNYTEIGRFIAFWQLFAVYSAILRGVDPYDQPDVESAKILSWQKRLKFKGLA